jgi:hypothetical protein
VLTRPKDLPKFATVTKRLLALIAAISVVLAAGCAPSAEIETPEPVASETTPVEELPEPEFDSITQELIAIATSSFDLMMQNGLLETYSMGDLADIELYFPREVENLPSLLLRRDGTDKNEIAETQIIDFTDFSTIFALLVLLESGSSQVTKVDDSTYTFVEASVAPMRLIAENGVLISAESLDEDWFTSFNYEPDPEYLELLREALALQEEPVDQ